MLSESWEEGTLGLGGLLVRAAVGSQTEEAVVAEAGFVGDREALRKTWFLRRSRGLSLGLMNRGDGVAKCSCAGCAHSQEYGWL